MDLICGRMWIKIAVIGRLKVNFPNGPDFSDAATLQSCRLNPTIAIANCS